jgi:hypothetical protein
MTVMAYISALSWNIKQKKNINSKCAEFIDDFKIPKVHLLGP